MSDPNLTETDSGIQIGMHFEPPFKLYSISRLVVAFLYFCLAADSFAAAQVSSVSVPNNLTVNPPQSITVNFVLARTGATPASMRVQFYLATPSGGGIFLVNSPSYNVPGSYTANITIPNDCYTPAMGWRIYAVEQTQTSSGSYSYSQNFSFVAMPPDLIFTPLSGNNRLVISRSDTATVDATNLTTNDTIYGRINILNDGCATAANCYVRTLVNGVAPFGDYALPNIPAGSGIALNAPFPPGSLPPGSNTIKFQVLGGNDPSHNFVQKTFFVASPPTIVQHPTNQSVIQGSGSNTVFSVTATGNPAPTYRWFFNGTNINGATTATFTVVNPQQSNSGVYSVQASNYAGVRMSSNATLAVYVPPSLSAEPPSRSVNQSNATTFTVIAAGTMPLMFQWQFNGTNIHDATNTSYNLPSVMPANAGDYQVIVTNGFGSVTSGVASLTVNYAPVIRSQPQSLNVAVNSSATFTVAADSFPPPEYRWFVNGNEITGATASSLTITNAQSSDAGTYFVVLTNSLGVAISSDAYLIVNETPSWSQFYGITLTNSSQVLLEFSGETGATYVIEGSSNIVDWFQLETLVLTNQVQQFTDEIDLNGLGRFYRLKRLLD